MTTMRSDWFQHVEKTRKKLSRGCKEKIPHRTAMKAASITWPKVKDKLLKRRKRDAKKLKQKDVPKKPVKKTQDDVEKNIECT
jgi:hypothetical protein